MSWKDEPATDKVIVSTKPTSEKVDVEKLRGRCVEEPGNINGGCGHCVPCLEYLLADAQAERDALAELIAAARLKSERDAALAELAAAREEVAHAKAQIQQDGAMISTIIGDVEDTKRDLARERARLDWLAVHGNIDHVNGWYCVTWGAPHGKCTEWMQDPRAAIDAALAAGPRLVKSNKAQCDIDRLRGALLFLLHATEGEGDVIAARIHARAALAAGDKQ